MDKVGFSIGLYKRFSKKLFENNFKG